MNYFDLKGDHYLVNKQLVAKFKEDIDIFFPGNYPTYIIIDRNGEIVTAEAALPSDGDKLLEQIRRVLQDE